MKKLMSDVNDDLLYEFIVSATKLKGICDKCPVEDKCHKDESEKSCPDLIWDAIVKKQEFVEVEK